MTETCVICKRKDDRSNGFALTRCCCEEDWICGKCCRNETLDTYLKTVDYYTTPEVEYQ